MYEAKKLSLPNSFIVNYIEGQISNYRILEIGDTIARFEHDQLTNNNTSFNVNVIKNHKCDILILAGGGGRETRVVEGGEADGFFPPSHYF